MFCSNQEFLICGNKKDSKVLEKAISLIYDGFEFKPRYYRIAADGFLYFYSFTPDDKNDVVEICKEDMNLNYYLSIIHLYLSSFTYRDTLKNHIFNEYGGADGSSQEGWEIVLDTKTLVKKVIIRPYWCFYHK